MATIKHAVVLVGEDQITVHHLCRTHADAVECARASERARVAVVEPPLASVRCGDAWAVLESEGKKLRLRVFAAESEALAAAARGGRFIRSPIRRTMPAESWVGGHSTQEVSHL